MEYTSKREDKAGCIITITTKAEAELYKTLMEKAPEIPEKFEIRDFMEMKYLTTGNYVYGAWGILDTAVQKEILEKFGECIVIPSSIHEVILLPTESDFGSIAASSLVAIIKKVNETEVAPEEVLSNRAYLLTARGVIDYEEE